MSELINLTVPVYFYDDRCKIDELYQLKEILFSDDEICLCNIEEITHLSEKENIKYIQFNISGGEVINSDYSSFIATNEWRW